MKYLYCSFHFTDAETEASEPAKMAEPGNNRARIQMQEFWHQILNTHLVVMMPRTPSGVLDMLTQYSQPPYYIAVIMNQFEVYRYWCKKYTTQRPYFGHIDKNNLTTLIS